MTQRRLHWALLAIAIPGWLWAGAGGGGSLPLPSTLDDFFLPGTQPFDPDLPGAPERIRSATECRLCHGDYSSEHAPFDTWRTSMMANATRDPLFHACLAVAQQDASFAGDLCLRCHSTRGWIEERSTPTDGSALAGADFEGVTCHVCHRMVDPIYEVGVNPAADVAELAAIGPVPTEPHTGTYIIDRQDRRRGPFDLDADYVDFDYHFWERSPFHRESLLCATCHDVSNPLFERQGGAVPHPTDTYVPGPLGVASTAAKYDQFPVERTYSEWLNSAFADGPIDMGGRFGGNLTAVSTCQDCHMPDATGTGCNPVIAEVERDDVPAHSFSGAANWVLDAILALDQSLLLYGPDEISGMTPKMVAAAKVRNAELLSKAADLTVAVDGQVLTTRVTNQTGHKLPTGYPEGRRMWVTVRAFDADDGLVAQYGGYDPDTAELDTASTIVYEAHLGVDATMAALTGLPVGESFHFALNNTYYKDNRIPPRGFTHAAFAAVQAAPVGTVFEDGQYWHDAPFALPCTAVRAEVGLYYQTASKEYIEFLWAENTTNDRGDILYDLWEQFGKGAPIEMQFQQLDLDCDANGQLDGCDLAMGAAFDVDGNGVLDHCQCADGAASTCCDGDADAVRDDNCRWCACADALCDIRATVFADLGGSFGSCAPDGFSNIHDRNHALSCFAGVNTCDEINLDAGGSFGDCCPDGFCNIHDANHALSAFSGATSCSCPGACVPAPLVPAPVGVAELDLVPTARVIAPGAPVPVRVFLRGRLADLQSYQLEVLAGGGQRGRLELEAITIDPRKDGVFAGAAGSFDAVNLARGQMLHGLSDGGVAVDTAGYLATYHYRASADAAGAFIVEVRHDTAQGDQTFLVADFTGSIAVSTASPAVIQVDTKATRRPTRPRSRHGE